MRKTGKNRYNTTPHASPEAALHTGQRPNRSTPHLNATGGGERPETSLPTATPAPRPRPSWPKTSPPPPNHQNTPQDPHSGGRPKRGPKRQSDTRAPPTPDPAKDLGFPPENPGGDQKHPLRGWLQEGSGAHGRHRRRSWPFAKTKLSPSRESQDLAPAQTRTGTSHQLQPPQRDPRRDAARTPPRSLKKLDSSQQLHGQPLAAVALHNL
jgi:hypothetical protein